MVLIMYRGLLFGVIGALKSNLVPQPRIEVSSTDLLRLANMKSTLQRAQVIVIGAGNSAMSVDYKTIDTDFFSRQLSNEATRMLLAFEMIKKDKGLNRTDEGTLVENLVVDFLERYLPKRLSVGRGYVMSDDGKTSLQQDVVIYNADDYILLKNIEGCQFYPIECVYAVVEVKSTLTKSTLKVANRNARSIKYLSGTKLTVHRETGEIQDVDQYGAVVFSSVFAFKSGSKLETCMKNVEDESTSIDSVLILNKGLINYARVEKVIGDEYFVVKTMTSPTRQDDLITPDQEEKDSLLAYEPMSEDNLGGILGLLIEQIVSHAEEYKEKGGRFSLLNYLTTSTARKAFRVVRSPSLDAAIDAARCAGRQID
jgi:Domain of unknown function (DUF6602)